RLPSELVKELGAVEECRRLDVITRAYGRTLCRRRIPPGRVTSSVAVVESLAAPIRPVRSPTALAIAAAARQRLGRVKVIDASPSSGRPQRYLRSHSGSVGRSVRR